MTNLDDEVHTVLDDNLCNFAGRLVQNDTEVVLRGGKCLVRQPERKTHLGEDTMGRIRSIGVVEYLGLS